MTFKKTLITLLTLVLPLTLFAQVEAVFNGVHLNESIATVTQKINAIAGTSKLITVDIPTFPLAKSKEAHLVCSNVKTANGTLGKVVFTFADDKLVYIEAKGNTMKTFTSTRKDTARTYMDYTVYFKDKLFLKKKSDRAWILSQGAMHVNLFTWENPHLKQQSKTTKVNASTKVPAFLKMGASFDELKASLEANSAFTHREELDGSDPNAQFQINCFGVDYLGFPRKMEARFGDNKLNVVWILTGKGEEDRIRKALIKQYGKPIYVNKDWEIFNNWQVGLRKDKPEVLLIEQKIGLQYKKSFFKQ